MAKRGRKKKFKIDFNVSPETYRSIFAVLLLLFSLNALVSFLAPNYYLNEKIQLIFRKSFGSASVIIPLITALTGLLFIDSIKLKVKELRVIVGLLIFLIGLAGIFHIFTPVEEARALALDGKGGGYVGYIISSVLINLLSIYGGLPVLAALLFVSLIFIFNISIDQAFVFIKEKVGFVGFSKKGKKADDIVVTSGMGEDEKVLPETKLLSTVPAATSAEENAAGRFEILPSMSEPQSVPDSLTDVSEVLTPGTHRPNDLPYPDKVWELPPYDLLSESQSGPPDTGNVEQSKKIIEDTLRSFDIQVAVVDIQIGPTVTKYALDVPAGVNVTRISNLQTNLALALASPTGSVRMETPIPGKALIGVEVPNKRRAIVDFKSLITSEQMKANKSKLAITLGKDVGGVTHVYDIAQMPHLLIAGTTGSGKSIFIHNLIFSILFRATPQEVKFIMIDPKKVELQAYADLPHLYTPLVIDVEKAPSVFKWAVTEMQQRLKKFSSARVRNIAEYNEHSGFQAMPYIVIVVDELAEIMLVDSSAVEKSIIRLAQLARATGIHLVLAVQRPSSDIITGRIKANISCRVAFNTAGQVDSRVIIDQPGAEKLLGKGDMLFVPPDRPTPTRLQGAWISKEELERVVDYLKGQGMPPEYNEEILETSVGSDEEGAVGAGGEEKDDKYDEALEIVIASGKASASLLQRRLSIGYARAARIIDIMEKNQVVGPGQGSRPREVLLDNFPEDFPPENDIKAPQIRVRE